MKESKEFAGQNLERIEYTRLSRGSVAREVPSSGLPSSSSSQFAETTTTTSTTPRSYSIQVSIRPLALISLPINRFSTASPGSQHSFRYALPTIIDLRRRGQALSCGWKQGAKPHTKPPSYTSHLNMDDKGKGVSLRQKRTGKLKISAPTLISAPASATASSVDLPSRPSTRGTANSPAPSLATPRPRDRSREDKTADLVKRRYSTRFNNPPDLSGDPDATPTLPSIPSRFAVQPPSRGSDVSTGRAPKLDPKVLKDPNFKAEDCTYPTFALIFNTSRRRFRFVRCLRAGH